ncbi:hypothetical protein Tco_0656721 [Tanacetum coccineum]|uniref:Uncharacterized protein n=1 Tax=Tanacetum coccineum TaxID=301880 RepID=A0ABQ4X9J9_9ASTR
MFQLRCWLAKATPTYLLSFDTSLNDVRVLTVSSFLLKPGCWKVSADLFIHTFLKLHYWTLTLEVSQTSTLITGVSLLIPSSSRIPTLPGHVANLLAILSLYSTLPIVVTFPLSLVVNIICYLAFLLFGNINVYEVSFKGISCTRGSPTSRVHLSRFLMLDSYVIFTVNQHLGGDDDEVVCSSKLGNACLSRW